MISKDRSFSTLFKPPSKIILHCLLRNCEIVRLSQERDHQGLEKSIENSKSLKFFRKLFPFSQPYRDQGFEKLCQIKNVTEKIQKQIVRKNVKELHCTLYAHSYIVSLMKEKVNLEELLRNIEITETEQKLHFFNKQQDVPKFKITGKVGVLNFIRLLQSSNFKNIFKATQQTNSSLIQISLFITLLAIQVQANRLLGYTYWRDTSREHILSQFQKLYQTLFFEFNLLWIQNQTQKTNKKNINLVLKEFHYLILNWDIYTFQSRIKSYCSN